MNKHIYFFTVFMFLTIFCTGQKTYKTVFERLQTTEGGCDFKVVFPTFDQSSINAEASKRFTEKDRLVLKATDTKKQYKLLADSIQELLQHYKKTLPADYDFYNKEVLANGSFLERDKKKWIFKNSEGKAVNNLKFDYILPDTFDIGFVGFQNGRANYYDGNTGKALLDQSYLYIKITEKREFIVQGVNGFGLIKNNEVIIEPYLDNLTFRKAGDRIYYSFYIKKDRKSYMLLDDLKTLIPAEPRTPDRYLGADYFFRSSNLYNLKTGKKLLCDDKERQIIVLSEKDKRLSLQIAGDAGRYLIDFDGNILSNTRFLRLGVFDKDGHSVSEVRENPDDFRSKSYKGVIDLSGNWIVEPKYHFIRKVNDFWLVVRMDTREFGLMDANGKEVVPLSKKVVSQVYEDKFLVGTRTDEQGGGNATLINMKTGETLKENLPFVSCHYFITSCDKEYYIVDQGTKKILVDEDFNVITGPHHSVYEYNGYIYCGDLKPEPVYHERFRLDCKENPVPFEVDNRKIIKHRFWNKLTDDLDYLNDMNSQGYLIYKNEKVSPLNFKNDLRLFKPMRFANLFIAGIYSRKNYCLFNEKGDVLIPFGTAKFISPYEGDGRQASLRLADDKGAILTANGNLVGNQIFKYSTFVPPGLFIVSNETERGVINQNGDWLLPLSKKTISATGGILKVNDGVEERWYDSGGNRLK